MEAAIIVVVQVIPQQGLTRGIVKDELEEVRPQLPSPSSKTEAVD
jgi:hypothetical protein